MMSNQQDSSPKPGAMVHVATPDGHGECVVTSSRRNPDGSVTYQLAVASWHPAGASDA